MEGEEIKTTFHRQTPTQTDNRGTRSWRGRFMEGGQRQRQRKNIARIAKAALHKLESQV